MTDPIRLALIDAIRKTRPSTSDYWAERLAWNATSQITAELRWLDIYEAHVPELQAGKEVPCPSL